MTKSDKNEVIYDAAVYVDILYPSGGVQGVKTFEEISVRPTVGADGGTSMIVKTVNSETGETLKVVHRVVDATGKVIHEDVKFP